MLTLMNRVTSRAAVGFIKSELTMEPNPTPGSLGSTCHLSTLFQTVCLSGVESKTIDRGTRQTEATVGKGQMACYLDSRS